MLLHNYSDNAVLGALIIVLILKGLSKGAIGDLSSEQFQVFVVELSVEFWWELIFSISIKPIIRKFTVLKTFEPSKVAKTILIKNIGYFILLSIMTYPLLLYVMLSF